VSAALRLGVREESEPYEAGVRSPRGVPEFPEATLTALWLLGRVPAEALPLPVLRPGRAGRGPGPDVREAVLRLPSGVARAGDVEVHLRASDFRRHGHAEDPAYAGVILHLCWLDDRVDGERGGPTPLPGGGVALTVELASALPRGLRDPARIEALVARGPAAGIATPCAGLVGCISAERAVAVLRDEGRKRLAERAWRAWRLADRYGFAEAFALLLDRTLASSAGRVREGEARRAALAAAITARLAAAGDGDAPASDALVGLERLALQAVSDGASGSQRSVAPGVVIEGLRVEGIGQARAAELGWNVALPLLSALAAAYDDVALARAVSRLADRWPAPRPYGRTCSLAASIGGVPASTGGALAAQGLLHLQDLWCTRAGCGTCPASASASVDAGVAFGSGGEVSLR